VLITPSFSYGTVGVELPPPKRLAHVLIVRKHSDLSWVAHRGVRPQLDWPQKQSGSSVKWMYTAFGSVIRWCSHVFVMNTYMRAPPYAITYWPWSSTMLSLSDWRWSDHCGDASHSELPLFVILCFFFLTVLGFGLFFWLHPPSI
jgi:hypothetical protein